jgi:nickel/cobalt transporter (NicO) family protein
MVRAAHATALAIFWWIACAGIASAHPLGNFTINHLAVVRTAGNQLQVHYVLDIAEIPSFQIMHGSSNWNRAARSAWSYDEAERVKTALAISADGTPVALQLARSSDATRPGAGGLPTLYWTGDYIAVLSHVPAHVAIVDSVYGDRRIGWKDIVLPGGSEPTHELRQYPSALIGSPRHNDRASFDLSSAGAIAHASITGDAQQSWSVATIVAPSALSDLFANDHQTPWWILLTILAAFGLGALHALEPGHGKALLAFTLVGSRATFKQAGILAAALTFAHTIAVLLLGLVLFFAAGFATESLFTWITLLSGLAVALIGARALANALKRMHQSTHHTHEAHRAPAHDNHQHDHDHAHDHHQHAHDGQLDHEHGHSHAIPGDAPLHFHSAVIAAMSGGIAPCPAAIVVLLTALHLHRVGYGILLIVIFSLGLAAVLTGLGIAVVNGAAWLQRRSGFATVARYAPLVTATVISIIGATMLAQGLVDRGVPTSVGAVVALTLAAIAAYALVPRFRHARVHAALPVPTRSSL